MIRQATEDDVNYYFGQRGLKVPPNPVIDICLVVSNASSSVLLVLAMMDDKSAEVHVCYTIRFMKHFRELCVEVFEHCKHNRLTKLYTTTNKRQIIDNTVKNFGFMYIDEYNSSNVYCKEL